MIPAASITHVHNHGASGLEIFAWCLAAVMVAELILAVRDAAPAWWDRWQARHAGEPVQDASEDDVCFMGVDHPCGYCTGAEIDCPGYGFVPNGPTRDEAARAVAEQETT